MKFAVTVTSCSCSAAAPASPAVPAVAASPQHAGPRMSPVTTLVLMVIQCSPSTAWLADGVAQFLALTPHSGDNPFGLEDGSRGFLATGVGRLASRKAPETRSTPRHPFRIN